MRGIACALRCAKLRVVRKHFVLPLRGAHLLQLVEGVPPRACSVD